MAVTSSDGSSLFITMPSAPLLIICRRVQNSSWMVWKIKALSGDRVFNDLMSSMPVMSGSSTSIIYRS